LAKITDNAQLRQRRTILYFIDAAERIINEDGVQAVTIRKVSELAGYTSATLYNYFDNLNHVIFLATMTYLDAYAREVPKRIKGLTDSRDIYYTVVDCFCKHAFAHPNIFEILFFTNRDGEAKNYGEQYYELFPERRPSGFYQALQAARLTNIRSRSAVYTALCVEQGYLTPESAHEYDDWAEMSFRYFLTEVKMGYMDMDTARKGHISRLKRLMNIYVAHDAARAEE
jgi:AcrR family transcriptional regulator